MNNYYPYRFFQGPLLPFVGGLLVGGIFSPKGNNNNFQPQPFYPPNQPPMNQPPINIYPQPLPPVQYIYPPIYPYPPSSDSIYVLNDPSFINIPTNQNM